MNGPLALRATSLDSVALRATSLESVAHGFFTRQGGCSEGIYASLNCGYGSADDATRITENRARVAHSLGVDPAYLVTAYQIHGASCATVRAPWQRSDAPRADAMVTDRPGLALGILTADCAPVLFADVANGVIGAAHAGWKGARAGIVQETVAAMARLGAVPERIVAAIGPTIAQTSYEVGPEFRAALIGDDASNEGFFRAGAGDRSQFDLAAYVLAQVTATGITQCEMIDADTAADPDRFFSYRRASRSGEVEYGRMIAAIALR